ncbi:MAG TPA: hypothetical protein VGF99_03630 [Myxococcota bacterium]
MSFAAATRSMNTGRHLRTRTVARDVSGSRSGTPVVKNAQVRGDELLEAVTFLGDVLGLPRLHDADRTSEVINIAALRAAAGRC